MLTTFLPVCRYGLLASLLADHQDDFDQFLAFYNHYENSQGLMCWQQVIAHRTHGFSIEQSEPIMQSRHAYSNSALTCATRTVQA